MSVIEQERTELPKVIHPNVQRSAELMDEICPGWADKINLDDFDIQNPYRCVLGQVFKGNGGFAHGCELLTGRGANWVEWAFHGTEHNPDWRLAIQARKTK